MRNLFEMMVSVEMLDWDRNQIYLVRYRLSVNCKLLIRYGKNCQQL